MEYWSVRAGHGFAGVHLSRIVDASFHSVNLVPCRLLSLSETSLLGWSVSTIFMLKRFRILELAERQALMLGMGFSAFIGLAV